MRRAASYTLKALLWPIGYAAAVCVGLAAFDPESGAANDQTLLLIALVIVGLWFAVHHLAATLWRD